LLSKPTTIEQIDAWRAAKSETEHLEFKEAKNQFDFDSVLAYCVAIGNEGGGVLLLGIANKPPRPVVGTNAYLDRIAEIKGNILNKLHFRVDIEEVQHPDGRVLVFHIPPRPIGRPYHVDGTYYMRSGESLVAMTPEQLEKIFDEGRSSTRRGVVMALASVFILGIIGWLWVKYQAAEHKPRQHDVVLSPGPTETHPTYDNATADVGHPEQKSNAETHDTTGVPSEKVKNQAPYKGIPINPQAELQFSFFTPDPNKFPILETDAPLIDGVVTVEITALNKGTVPAKNGWLLVTICNDCRYAEEPQNMVPSPDAPMANIVRERRFDEIYAGTIAVSMKLKIIPPAPPYDSNFLIAGNYVCEGCPRSEPKKQQLLKVNVVKWLPKRPD
jgi:hypothetical protein